MSVVGPIVVLCGVWLQIAIEPFVLFHHSVLGHISSTVMFHR